MLKKRMPVAILLAMMVFMGGCAQQVNRADYIGLDAAKSIALEAAGVPSADFSAAGLENREGIDYYAICFTADGQRYDYDVDAVTGVVIASRKSESPDFASGQAQSPQGSPASDALTDAAVSPEQAKEIALAHAGLAEGDVTFVKSKLEWDDGRQIYDVEFYTADFREYDYEIDSNTGDILSYDYDADSYTPSAGAGSGSEITREEAKNMALAKVPGATDSDIYEFEVDYDDGRLEYEGKIVYNGMEYEFTIDGYSGTIRSWETEPFDGR